MRWVKGGGSDGCKRFAIEPPEVASEEGGTVMEGYRNLPLTSNIQRVQELGTIIFFKIVF